MKLNPLILITLVLNISTSSKILIIFPNPSKSHGILGEGFVTNLLKAGHQVTYITAVPIKNTSENLHQIDVSINFQYAKEVLGKIDAVDFLSSNYHWKMTWESLKGPYAIVNNTIRNSHVQKMLFNVNETFDAVIAEWLFSEVFSGFAAVFGCPLIWSSSMDPHAMVLSLIDESPNTAYVPEHLSDAVPPFTFYERAKELVLSNFYSFMRWYFTSKQEETFYEENFAKAIIKRGRIPPPYEKVKYNASLMFGNSHVSTGLSIRLPQNYKAIAGYHIKDEVPPLPENFQEIFNSAKNGVIYFSLGSVVPSNKLPEEMSKAFIELFGTLKQIVIWKFDKMINNLPKNVHIVDWAPQQSILAHPKCILFITHGGLLSTIEAVHYGKPLIGIPVYGDQFLNVRRVVKKGFGLEVTLGKNLYKRLKVAVEDILTNPMFTKRAQEFSYVYHHRIAKPSEELVHWVEHVIHTKGAPELRSPALYMPWYQKQYLDLAILVVMLVYIIYKIITFICSRNKNEDVRKKNN